MNNTGNKRVRAEQRSGKPRKDDVQCTSEEYELVPAASKEEYSFWNQEEKKLEGW